MIASLKNKYSLWSVFFGVIWLVSIIGFHKTYTVKLFQDGDLNWTQHFHGNLMMLWFLFLIVQPILIPLKQLKLHRLIGKASYVIAPLLVYSIYLITKMMYLRDVDQFGEGRVLSHMSIEIPSMILFSLFYALAIYHKKRAFIHLRYMVGTSLLLIGPGLGRALIIVFGVHPMSTMVFVFGLPLLFVIVFLIVDVINKQNIKPFLSITILLAIHALIGLFQSSTIWQAIARGFVNIFIK